MSSSANEWDLMIFIVLAVCCMWWAMNSDKNDPMNP